MFASVLCLAFLVSSGTKPSPTSAPTPSPSAGKVGEHRVASSLLGGDRPVWVYTPPGYARDAASDYDLLIVFDGSQYLSEIPLPAMLDALLAERKAPPFVAVMIDNGSGAARLADLANRFRFAEFLSGELIEWVRARWKVTRDPRRTILAGSSAGSLAAAYAAFRRPDLFGNVLSQSGAFWRGDEGSNESPYEWLTSQYAASPRRNIRFFLDVGALETQGALGGAAPSILEANRRLRDVLRKKGYDVSYEEIPGGSHSPESWRRGLPAAIAALARR